MQDNRPQTGMIVPVGIEKDLSNNTLRPCHLKKKRNGFPEMGKETHQFRKSS